MNYADAPRGQCASLLHNNACACLAHLAEADRVPVREPKATVRLCTADGLWLGRAVDAVAGQSESHPRTADRIVRPRWK